VSDTSHPSCSACSAAATCESVVRQFVISCSITVTVELYKSDEVNSIHFIVEFLLSIFLSRCIITLSLSCRRASVLFRGPVLGYKICLHDANSATWDGCIHWLLKCYDLGMKIIF